ncbi:MAG: type IX secretion system sortase PorU [Cytophagaceae bacterium]|nr:type IX secretion system sortase PorU [Cytophagaceae bacterium]
MKTLRYLLVVFLWVNGLPVLAQPAASVLSRGTWYKIGVTESGVYRLNPAWLRKAGLNLNGLNPRNLRIYGNGGQMLPQANAATRPIDLVENALWVAGEADGRLDADDYVLFYGESPHPVAYNRAAGRFTHQTNLYSDTTFYFLNVGETPGLRVNSAPTVPANVTLTTFDDYFFHEKEYRNILGSGREWYGEVLAFGDQAISFSMPGLVAGAPVRVTSAVVAAAQAATEVGLKLNGQAVGSQSITAVSADRYDYKGVNALNTFSVALPTLPADEKLNFTVSYNRNGQASAQAYLNWLGVQAKRSLRLYGAQTQFRSLESQQYAAATFALSAAAPGLRVWDVTKAKTPLSQSVVFDNGAARFSAKTDTLREFVAFTETGLPEPATVRAIPNQNLRDIAAPDLLVITAPAFRPEAERLAAFRRQHDGLRVAVTTPEEIYNEFSSGRMDVTALRDFVRRLYQKPGSSLKYLLLFGDATFDYKNTLGGNAGQGYVPVYQSRESLHPIYSYSSDDYFGFLKNGEGTWEESFAGDHTLDVGIGRLPVKTREEAVAVVDKLLRYEDPATFGPWRQKLVFVADNGDYNLHQADADRLAQTLTKTQPNVLTEKVYVDAYPRTTTPTGEKTPEVNRNIARQIENGALIINYTGHGGESGWAQEQILTREDIFSWRNIDRMPLMVTATCEFGRYDNPGVVSGAELALLQARSGAIGLVTTTRPVFANTNFLVSEAFYQVVFQPVDGQLPRLGDVMRLTKNKSLSGRINRNFALLGDPSMRLGYPPATVVLTTPPDTLKALRRVTLTGEVRRADGQRDATFAGTAYVTVLDKPATLRTRGAEDPPMNYDVQRNVLFNGTATVRAGRFACSFIVPKDLDARLGQGKISLYAQRNAGADASGAASVGVGGSQATAPTDTQPPRIDLFLNDTTFRDGDQTAPSARLLARFYDESGINVGGQGHDLTATLDDTLTWTLNDAYRTLSDQYQRGSLTYALPTLSPGIHTIRLKAWDVYNNPGEEALRFRVETHTNSTLKNVDCFPNPLQTQTTFRFEHDAAGDDLDTQVDVLSLNGQLIRRLSAVSVRADSPLRSLTWDGRSDSGEMVTAGIYFYRIFVRSFQTGLEQRGSGKLILAR